MAIRLVGFDGDDTLSLSEGYYRVAHAAFVGIVGHYVDLADAGLHERLLAHGVPVLDARPKELGPELVGRYLAWKKAGVL